MSGSEGVLWWGLLLRQQDRRGQVRSNSGRTKFRDVYSSELFLGFHLTGAVETSPYNS